ncbi:Branched-chain amino acid transport protein [Halanaeroarchaeum sp. HSR-CO]|uniref:AzlD family protein n=1 Tax=Halanaeroarchaeum sp. HSR-CO TaxID=2866382 RepID=UPI00217DD59A|nr:AzlD domain-containing protein [Halanaeroarchaeum sp. HSR-CO]UWG48159.1 Branched-chain amino acid transport protein [Halanaeroarchaeum sp. HSR-CO]
MIGSEALALDPLVVGVILGMAAVTVVAKLGGLWVLSRFEVSDRLEAGVSVLPGAIVVALLGPELANGGPAEWGAAAVTGVVMWRTENILLALVAGVAAVVAFRGLFPL